jgi:hypothetical protein
MEDRLADFFPETLVVDAFLFFFLCLSFHLVGVWV